MLVYMNNFILKWLTFHILHDADALMMPFVQDFEADFQKSMPREKNYLQGWIKVGI